MDNSRRYFASAVAATVLVGGAQLVWEWLRPYAGGMLVLAGIAILVWGFWPSLKNREYPWYWTATSALLLLALLLGISWKIGSENGYREAVRIASRSLGPAIVQQPGHDFKIGDAVRIGDDGNWQRAKASGDQGAAGAVVGDVNGNEITLVRSGFVAVRHSLGEPGEMIFLSRQVPGGPTTEQDSKANSQQLGFIVNSNLLLIDVGMAWRPGLIEYSPSSANSKPSASPSPGS